MTRLEALLTKASGTVVAIPDRVDHAEPLYGFGPADAQIVIVCDAPNYDEYEQQQPWLGRRGTKVVQHARYGGIDLRKCRVEYVYPRVHVDIRVEHTDLDKRIFERERLYNHVGAPSFIITIGDDPLEAFTGFRDSLRRRGSVYEWRGIKVLAMIDPSVIYARKEYEKHARIDWERAKLMATEHTTHHRYCGCAHRIEREHITPYGDIRAYNDAIYRYCEAAQDPQTIMAIDIETPKVKGKRQIVCVSFAYTPHESLVLPFDIVVGNIIHSLCASPCIKVGHNFISFDRWWFEKEGIKVGGEIRDTLAMHHCLDPASRHSLEFITSRYTWEPFYKSEAKGHDENAILKTPETQQAYYEYCGLDSCVTRELHDILWSQLESHHLDKFYHAHYKRLYDPILDLSSCGVRIDQEYRKALMGYLLHEAEEARDKLGEINGAPLYTSGFTVSGALLKKMLYEKMGVAAKFKKRASGEVTETSDITTLLQIKAEYAKTRPDVVEVVDLAITHSKAQKAATFCYDKHFSADGRFRFTLKVNTEAARLSSSAAPDGTGANSQNWPRDKRVRRMVLPEEGHIILDADLSQVESRFCFAYTGDSELIRLARLRSTEFDQHKFVAALVFKKVIEAVEPGERQVCKSIGHGAQRAMQGVRMAETLMKEGYVYSAEECDELIEEYHKAFPGIRKWHQRIRQEVRQNKLLINSWGRIWDVYYEEINDELFRRAYSWLLQSECGDLMNQYGFIALWYWLKEHEMKSRILLHIHDELVMSVDPDEAYDVAVFLQGSLERSRVYNGAELSIPVEFKCGLTWVGEYEWKILPAREEFETVVKRLLNVNPAHAVPR